MVGVRASAGFFGLLRFRVERRASLIGAIFFVTLRARVVCKLRSLDIFGVRRM